MDNIIRFINEYLNSIVIIISIVGFIGTPILYFWRIRRWKQDKVRQLDDLYGNGKEAIRFLNSSYYIPINYQTTKPHDVYKDSLNNSQNDTSIDVPERGPLVQKILDDILKSNIKKRYMILGGSGMGKSTFSASLYANILNHFKLRRCPFPIYICSLFDSGIFTRLNQISNEIIQSKQNINEAVIILDGLDENAEAASNYKSFLSDIESATKSFRVVVITSRTQLFPHEDHEPTKTKIMFTAGNGNVIEYDKYYISPFSKDETEKYLKYKYKDDPIKYNSAKNILDNTKDLVSRPMVLSSLDGLIHLSDKQKLSLTEVYLAIVEYWRERDNMVKGMDNYKYYAFSKKIALHIYEKYHAATDDKKELAISLDDFNQFLSDNYGDDNPYSFRVRSLLNRTSGGKVKFSHRSFFELFIAIIAIENPGLSIILEDDETSLAPAFFNDIYYHYRQKRNLPHIVFRDSDSINIQESFDCNEVQIKFQKEKVAYSEQSSSENNQIQQLYDFYEALVRRLSNQIVYAGYFINFTERVFGYRAGDINLDEIRNDPKRVEFYEKDMEQIPDLREQFKKKSSSFITRSISLLYEVQSVFSINNILSVEKFESIENEYNRLISNIQSYFKQVDMVETKYHHNMVDFKKPHSSTQLFIFPDILDLNHTILSSYIKSTKECFIGQGFNDDDKVFNLIDKLQEKQISRIYIFRESDDINHHVRFVSKLSNYCKDESDVFILVITIEGSRFFYVVTNKSQSLSEDVIKTCLLNMLKAKKQLS